MTETTLRATRANRPVWAEIDRAALAANVRAVRSLLRPGCRYMAVVKANAYGHGDVIAAAAALDAGAERLGVILVQEARRLREAGIDAPILLLHEPPAEQADDVIALRLTPTVYTVEGAAALAAAAERAGATLPVHVKVDTGLNRLGVPPVRLDPLLSALARTRRLEVEGFFSHFAVADPPDHPSIALQLGRFFDAADAARAAGLSPQLFHIGNSATALTHPEAHLDMVRVGIATYGIAPAPSLEEIVPLRPVMSLKAKVAMFKRVPAGEGVSYGLHYRLARDSNIVTLPLGYADGWPRHATGRTFVLIGGNRYPVVGTICMDAFMVDMGDDECAIGDEAVLIGEQGGERIRADDVARALGTIAYEVVTQVARRVERVPVGTA